MDNIGGGGAGESGGGKWRQLYLNNNNKKKNNLEFYSGLFPEYNSGLFPWCLMYIRNLVNIFGMKPWRKRMAVRLEKEKWI